MLFLKRLKHTIIKNGERNHLQLTCSTRHHGRPEQERRTQATLQTLPATTAKQEILQEPALLAETVALSLLGTIQIMLHGTISKLTWQVD
jgi:hypothetical protein